MCDICLTKSLISREALRGSQIEIKPYPFEETVEDEKGQTYKVQGTLPKNLRWRVKNGSRSHPEQFYVVEKLRDNLDALLQKSTISSSGTGAKKDIYVLETPRQTPGMQLILVFLRLWNQQSKAFGTGYFQQPSLSGGI